MTLTAEQINAMEAGPEMDRAVAEAIGLRTLPYVTGCCTYETADTENRYWWFSTRWDDAMFAAERFGDGILLSRFALKRLKVNNVWAYSLHHWDGASFLHAATGPLAISRAILSLHNGLTCETIS